MDFRVTSTDIVKSDAALAPDGQPDVFDMGETPFPKSVPRWRPHSLRDETRRKGNEKVRVAKQFYALA